MLTEKLYYNDAYCDDFTAELQAAKFRMARLEEDYFAQLALQYAGAGDTLLLQGSMKPDSARRLADAVARSCGGLAAVFAGEAGQYHYALVHGGGQDIAPLVKRLNAALCGACVGALMVIGMKHGQYQLEDTERRQKTNDRTIAFMEAFTRANGACRCSDLLGHDVATPEGFAAALEANLFRTRCADIVASAVELLEQVEI